MTFEQERTQIRRDLEAAIRLQREIWDETLATQELASDYGRDFYTLVAELAGGFKDNEAITADVINNLFAPHPVIYPEYFTRAVAANDGKCGRAVQAAPLLVTPLQRSLMALDSSSCGPKVTCLQGRATLFYSPPTSDGSSIRLSLRSARSSEE